MTSASSYAMSYATPNVERSEIRSGSTIRRVIRMALLPLCAAVGLSSASAQGGPPGGPPAGPPGGPPPGGGQAMGVRQGGPPPNGPARIQLERRLQERINQVVRKRLALTDDQFSRLQETASRIEDARRELRNDEMTTRFAMRQELLAGDRANEARVAELLDRLPRLERRRLDLMDQEQRELSKFLSATQRARYLGLQDELRRSMQDLQRRRMDGDSAAGPPLARPGARRLLKRPPGAV